MQESKELQIERQRPQQTIKTCSQCVLMFFDQDLVRSREIKNLVFKRIDIVGHNLMAEKAFQ